MNKEAIIDKTVREILPEISKDKFNWIKYYGEIALNGGEKSFEQYSVALNRWYKVDVYSNKKFFFTTIFVDITEIYIKKQELEGFFALSLDLLCILDYNGNFLQVNKEWEKIFGYTSEYLFERNIFEFIHEDDLEITKDIFFKLINNSKTSNFISRCRCLDKTYKYIEWSFHSKDNKIFSIARDISDKIEAE